MNFDFDSEEATQGILTLLPPDPENGEYFVVASDIPVGPKSLNEAQAKGWGIVSIIPYEGAYLLYLRYSAFH